ncbi:MAG: helix-turn-helix transcriptional regulator [Saprospiraceae bacterium]
MNKKINNVGTLEDLKDEFFGKKGTKKRDELEEGYGNFKIGVMLQEARLKKGLTQQELADKVGTTKSYISKIENSVKEARISTLEKIVELGFGGKLELKIKMN